MQYRLEIKEEARRQLRALPKEQRRNVGRRLDALQIDLSGDVKKLSGENARVSIACGYAASAFHSGKRFNQRLCCKRSQESI
jgi:uncharacterized protein YcbK (DUF882 family)